MERPGYWQLAKPRVPSPQSSVSSSFSVPEVPCPSPSALYPLDTNSLVIGKARPAFESLLYMEENGTDVGEGTKLCIVLRVSAGVVVDLAH